MRRLAQLAFVVAVALAAEELGVELGHALARAVESGLGSLPGAGLYRVDEHDRAYQLLVQNLLLGAGALVGLRLVGVAFGEIGLQRRGFRRGLLLASPVVLLNVIAAVSPVGPDAPTPAIMALATYLAVSLAIGFGEEVFYRGALLKLLDPDRRPLLAVSASAAIFGGAHVFDGLDFEADARGIANAIAVTLVLGVPFALIRLRTGSLWGLVVAHGLYDLVASIDHHGLGPAPTPLVGLVTVVCLSSITCALYVWWFRDTGGFCQAGSPDAGTGIAHSANPPN